MERNKTKYDMNYYKPDIIYHKNDIIYYKNEENLLKYFFKDRYENINNYNKYTNANLEKLLGDHPELYNVISEEEISNNRRNSNNNSQQRPAPPPNAQPAPPPNARPAPPPNARPAPPPNAQPAPPLVVIPQEKKLTTSDIILPESETKHDQIGEKHHRDDELCVICAENLAKCVILPCRHKCVCVKCSRTLCFTDHHQQVVKNIDDVNCPSCRGKITSFMPIF